MTIHIDQDLCKDCSLCVYYCPLEVLEMTDKMNRMDYNMPAVKAPDKCTECRLCEISCPDLAVCVE